MENARIETGSSMCESAMKIALGLALTTNLSANYEHNHIDSHVSYPQEIVEYLSKTDDQNFYLGKISSGLIALRTEGTITSFYREPIGGVTTFNIKVPKTKDIQTLVEVNLKISDIFSCIPDSMKEKITTVQRMV